MFFEYENVTLKITRNRLPINLVIGMESTRFVILWNLCEEGRVAVVWSCGKPFYTSLTTCFDLAPQKPST